VAQGALAVRVRRRRDRAGPVHAGRVDLDEAVGQLASHVRGAAQVAHLGDRRARRQPMGELDHGALGVAVDEQVGLAVDEDRAANGVGPVVVVRDAAKARLDAADDDRHVAERFAAALGVDHDRAVRAQAGGAARRVGIVGADAALAGVAVHHRVHVSAGHAEEQVRAPERAKRVRLAPVRLGQDADPEPLRLEQAADDRHAEARMIDIRVSGDEDDVARVPAQVRHLLGRHRQKWRRAEAMGPVLAIGEQGPRGRFRAASRVLQAGRHPRLLPQVG
jgi:hypothetical protein